MHAAVDITSRVYWDARPDRRSAPRTQISLSGRVRADQRATAYVVIRDISTDGFSFRSFEFFAPGMAIEIELKGVGLKPAEVIWEEDARTGCRFSEPLSEAELETVIVNQIA